ncbi:MAG: M48 family metalloprotease [Vicinamibacterales bacterium]
MKILVALMFTCVVCAAAPAHAQTGSLNDRLKQLQEARDKIDKKVGEIRISDADERKLGEDVSAKLRQEFGVYQDKDLTKYVSLVGKVLTQGSSRPYLDWQFIVLDTDGVNAFASPGGLIHVTRGLLGLITTESELAGVLGHEITHVTAKHTARAIQKNKLVSLTAQEVGGSAGLSDTLISQLAGAAYKTIISNAFDRDDEIEADRVGIGLANKAGYSPHGLSDVLKRLQERNRDQDQPNGLFASHPLVKDRIAGIGSAITEDRLAASATVAARYAKHITFTAKPIAEIPVIEGTRGLTGGESKAKDGKESAAKDPASKDPKQPEPTTPPKKKGGLLGRIGLTTGSQSQNTQTVASAGARGLGQPDRDAKGGSNPARVAIIINPAELVEFKKGIA